ncbi:MAG TPA: helix-turn-helix transcriptional regulator [Steroidobacteraceae bacterium]|nr:helix-turn-helix transcriptional regulator [Steroidobacteraceae bacterium]
MKVTQSAVLDPTRSAEARKLGASLARLRIARGVKQDQAALRAGLSRNTAYRMEKGDPGIAVGQILRYLDAIVPGKTLLELLSETDPALAALSAKEQRRRARELTERELGEIDF